MKMMKTMMAVAAFVLAIGPAEATPLRELIFQTMDQEHQGVLTQQEITTARKLGATWHHQYGDDAGEARLNALENTSARHAFPNEARKRHEWILECQIGFMMAAEAELWTP